MRVEPLIPKREREKERDYQRRPGGGRKPMDPRQTFEAIIFVLRTGCQWKSLPKERFGSASSVHKYFRDWLTTGFFQKLWQAGLAEYNDLEGIAWEWQSIGGSIIKAPMPSGRTRRHRGRKWKQTACPGGRPWRPAVADRDRRKPA